MRLYATILVLLTPLSAAAAAPCDATRLENGIPITTCVKADQRFAAIRASLVDAVRSGRIASASVAVIVRDAVLWEESVGWSDKQKKTAATPRMPYLLASLGKSMTATALMRLVERNRITLDAPVSRYLGNVQLTIHEGTSDEVTVRRVLDMTAEMPHSNLTFSSLAARRGTRPRRSSATEALLSSRLGRSSSTRTPTTACSSR